MAEKAKKKATAKQKAALAKGRAVLKLKRNGGSTLAAVKAFEKSKTKKPKKAKKVKRETMSHGYYGVTKEFPRGMVHLGHSPLRATCKKCGNLHSTSEHNSHAVYGEGSRVDKVVPAFALTHHLKTNHKIKSHPLKGAMKHFR